MEIFRLMGSVFIDNEKANKQIDETDKKGQSLAGTLGGMVGAAAKWGAAMAFAAGVTLVGGMIKGAMSADQLKKALNGLQASTGATDQEMQGMEKSLKRIYANNFGESFEDIAQSMGLVRHATGQAGDELEKTTQNAIMLRDTFGFEITKSVEAANQMMKQFGVTSDQAFAMLANGTQKGLNKSDDLIDTVNEYSIYFKTAGFDAKEMFAVFENASKSGVRNLDYVGDAFKEMVIRTKDMSDATRLAFTQLGLDSGKMERAFGEGGEAAKQAYQQMMQAITSIDDPLQKNAIGVALFGTKFEDLEAGAVEAMANIKGTVSDSADVLNQINAVKYDSFMEAMTGIGRQIQVGLLIPMGEKALPKLNEFGQWIQTNMPEIQEKMETVFRVAGKAVDSFSDGIDWARENSEWLIPVIVGLVAAITSMTIIGTINNLMALWKASTIAQTIAQGGLNAVLLANPIGIVIAIIGLLVAAGVALYMHWDTVKAKASGLWTSIKEVFGNIKSFVLGVWDSIVGGIKGSVNNIISSINRFIEGINRIQISVPAVEIPLVGKVGGFSVGLPDIDEIPLLAEGGDISKRGAAIVGDAGPELVELPEGARVTPLKNRAGFDFDYLKLARTLADVLKGAVIKGDVTVKVDQGTGKMREFRLAF